MDKWMDVWTTGRLGGSKWWVNGRGIAGRMEQVADRKQSSPPPYSDGKGINAGISRLGRCDRTDRKGGRRCEFFF